jgi:hypothetical protein
MDDQQALSYFDALAREVSLVGTDTEPGGQYVLRHRPELRRIMLRLMEADEEKQQQIQQVHQNAVRYYSDPIRRSQLARTEALYHGLMLGEAPRTEKLMDEIPTEEGVEAGHVPPPAPEDDPRPAWRAVAEAVGELPPAAITYLSARIQKDLLVPDAVWEVAHPRDRELVTLSRTSRRARERGNLASALQSLRHDRQNFSVDQLSPLYLIEVALLERLGEYDEAGKYARIRLKEISSKSTNPIRTVEYSLLAARIAARTGDRHETEHFLDSAHRTLLAASGSAKEYSAARFRRSERQLLRFAADCYKLEGSARTLQIITDWLDTPAIEPISPTMPVESTGGPKQFPALARYVISSGFTEGTADLHLSSLGQLLHIVRRPHVLTTLMTRLPKVNANRVAEALADWTVESQSKKGPTDNKAFGKLGKPPGPSEPIRIHDYWRNRLLENPDEVANRLPQIVKAYPISNERLADLMAALKPEARAEGEDPLEEARRAGDLMPGEGSHLGSKSSKAKQKK